jgi:(p)ppGpp synthase/HD superfamily hydrolase
LNLIQKADLIAEVAHYSIRQVRKNNGNPYIVHPREVAAIVAAVPGATDEMIAAALLHDVIEDTGTPLIIIEAVCGSTVATYVDQLSNKSKLTDGNRATRKAMDRDRLSKAVPEVKTIKLADIICNCNDFIREDPKFAFATYLPEKRLLLEVLTEGNADLYKRALQIVTTGKVG